MIDLMALAALIVWPVIPLFWIPVHSASRFFRRLGIMTYLLPVVTWLPLVYVIYMNRSYLLQFRFDPPVLLHALGLLLFLAGVVLQLWTAWLLGILGIMGFPEISALHKGGLVKKGAFRVVRHPTYLSHTLIFSGVFLASGVLAAGIVTALDFIIVNLLIIPLEERELLERFGEKYSTYRKEVPRFFPRI